MSESISVSTTLPVAKEKLYNDWLDGAEHTAFTGGSATCDPKVGGEYTAWDGYINGKNLELEPHNRILQSWRSSEFPASATDSKLEVLLESVDDNKTKITLNHTDIPDGQGNSYKSGWVEHYFDPMAKHYL